MKSYILIGLLAIAVVALLAACGKTTKTAKNNTDKEGANVTTTAPKPSTGGSAIPMRNYIKFKAASPRYQAEGEFQKWWFEKMDMDGKNLRSFTGQVKVDMSSVSENSAKLVEHLKAWDYFDIEKYKMATIDISGVEQEGDLYTAKAVINYKGAKQESVAQFRVIKKNPYRINGSISVDRSIFKIGVGNTGVPNDIKVEFETNLR